VIRARYKANGGQVRFVNPASGCITPETERLQPGCTARRQRRRSGSGAIVSGSPTFCAGSADSHESLLRQALDILPRR